MNSSLAFCPNVPSGRWPPGMSIILMIDLSSLSLLSREVSRVSRVSRRQENQLLHFLNNIMSVGKIQNQ